MICTLRHWEHSASSRFHYPPTSTTTTNNNNGPELLLTPEIPVGISLRDVSPLRQHPGTRQPSIQAPPVPFCIPISDILLVESHHTTTIHKLSITTKSFGVFELNCDGINGHDIIMAFLHASLPTERILEHKSDDCTSSNIRHSHSCLDMDGFTAAKVQERGETWPEKLSRRMGKVVSSFQEMSMTLCDVNGSCCQQVQSEWRQSGCNRDTSHYKYSSFERRDPPAVHFNELGLEEEETSSWMSSSCSPSVNSRKQQPNHNNKWQQQYGLSMEESELESTR